MKPPTELTVGLLEGNGYNEAASLLSGGDLVAAAKAVLDRPSTYNDIYDARVRELAQGVIDRLEFT